LPIRPENRAFYRGAEYLAFRAAVRERAGDRCEVCGAKNGEPKASPDKRFVCGLSHTDQDPRKHDVKLARWLCKGCHLAHDRANNYARSRRLKARAVGQAWISEELETAEMPEGTGRKE
jgi:hypothetical protein